MLAAARNAVLFLLVLFAAALLATGCGGDSDSDDSKSSDAKPASTSSDDSDSDSADDEEDAADEQVEENKAMIRAGIDYDEAVGPVLEDLAPLVTRASGVMSKADAGQIDIDTAAEGFARQAIDAAALLTRLQAIETDDDNLATAQQQLEGALAAYVASMKILASVQASDSTEAFDAKLAKADAKLTAMANGVSAWETTLTSKDETRLFPRAAKAAAAVGAAAQTFGS